LRSKAFAWLAVVMAVSSCAKKADAPASTSAPPASTTAAAPAANPSSARLVGRWLRADSDYVIQVESVGADGTLVAKYFNPGPIHVSRAEWVERAGKLGLMVELTDRNYPGNFYVLAYDPGSDSLMGVYNHLGQNQQFEVAFSRVAAPN
jgi:hypothetical protein